MLYLSNIALLYTNVVTMFSFLTKHSYSYVNVALTKPAYQRHPAYPGFDKYDASNAVDGLKSDLRWDGGQCVVSAGADTATWWVNLTSIHSIHHVTIYYRTEGSIWGSNTFLPASFLGFSIYISNTTDIQQGTLCFKDENFTLYTIPAAITVNCLLYGQFVIYYNERLSGVYQPDGYSVNAYNDLCEVEVFGCPKNGYYGSNCSIPCPDVNCQYCHIETGTCQGCRPGYRGHRCELECTDVKFEDGCQGDCGYCRNKSRCHYENGACVQGCEPGYKQYDCKHPCDEGFYGVDCNETCGHCLDIIQCFHINGTCLTGCTAGYHGDTCKAQCDFGKHGFDCNEECGHCRNVDQCVHANGSCLTGCSNGYQGELCKTHCHEGRYGVDCSEMCGHCANTSTCFHVNGTCLTGCEAGFQGELCKTRCDSKRYGINCNETCGRCRDVDQCLHTDGRCLTGCTAGYKGEQCKTTCEKGTYGDQCNEKCGHCRDVTQCLHTNGTCLTGCEPGYKGELCKPLCNRKSNASNEPCVFCLGNCKDDSSCINLTGKCANGCKNYWAGEFCQDCKIGYFGEGCDKKCGQCMNETACKESSGACPSGCQNNWEGPLCIASSAQVFKTESEGISTIYLYAIIGILAMLLVVALAVIILREGVLPVHPYKQHGSDDVRTNSQNASNHYDSLNRPGGMNIYFSLEPKKQESHYEDVNITM